jgi:hypothetical protein
MYEYLQSSLMDLYCDIERTTEEFAFAIPKTVVWVLIKNILIKSNSNMERRNQ